jgi:hypothetical protein
MRTTITDSPLLRVQLVQDEPNIATNGPELMVDAVEPLVHCFQSRVDGSEASSDGSEASIDRVEPFILRGESRVHLGKPAIDELGVFAKVIIKCFAAHRSLQKTHAVVQ